MTIDRAAAHARVDEILDDHLPSMMGRNGIDVSLKEFVDQVIDQAYIKGVIDERQKSPPSTRSSEVRVENFQPADYPKARDRKKAVEDLDVEL